MKSYLPQKMQRALLIDMYQDVILYIDQYTEFNGLSNIEVRQQMFLQDKKYRKKICVFLRNLELPEADALADRISHYLSEESP